MQNKLKLPICPPGTLSVASARRRFSSESLFNGGSEIIIEHGSQEYRLRRTRNGKLILNK